jgi:hypothetical protein
MKLKNSPQVTQHLLQMSTIPKQKPLTDAPPSFFFCLQDHAYEAFNKIGGDSFWKLWARNRISYQTNQRTYKFAVADEHDVLQRMKEDEDRAEKKSQVGRQWDYLKTLVLIGTK